MLNIKRFPAIISVLCIFWVAAYACAELSSDPGPLNIISGKFSFVVLGDNRSGDEIYSRLVKLAMGKKPDFMVNTGDEIRHDGNLAEWKKFVKLSGPVCVPYFLVPGNHDVGDKTSEETYKEESHLPGNGLYYSFSAGNSLFVFLDSVLVGQERRITGRQYEWLEDVLGKSRATHKFVFVHHPLYPEKGLGFHYGGSLDAHPADRDRLQALFEKDKVTAVFAGHEHLYLKRNIGGVLHIITGGGGAPLYAGDWEGGFYHFIYVTVDGRKVTFEVVDKDNRIRDSFQVNGNQSWSQVPKRSEFRSIFMPMRTNRFSVISPGNGAYFSR